MSDKMVCPGCAAYSSSVLRDVEDGDPCRFCGLSDAARTEIYAVRAKKADRELTERCAELVVRNSELERLNQGYRARFEAALRVLHEEPTPSDRLPVVTRFTRS